MAEPSSSEAARQILREMAAGREEALARLIAQFGGGLAVFATRYLGDPAAADEVVQDTFLRAWRDAARYDPDRGAVSTWLYRIAANLCIDRMRRMRLRQLVLGRPLPEDLADTLSDPAPGAETALASRQALAEVRRALLALPGRQRMAILLTVVAGLDNGEAAAVMGTSRGSLEQLLVRARRTLRTAILEDGESHDGA